MPGMTLQAIVLTQACWVLCSKVINVLLSLMLYESYLIVPATNT